MFLKRFLSNWKNNIYINVSSALFLCLIYLLFFHASDLTFFPNQTKLESNFFTDHVDNGNSVLNDTIETDSSVGIKCTIGNAFAYPYAGLEMQVPGDKILNISDYNEVKIDFQTTNQEHLFVYLLVKDKNLKDTSHRLVLRRLGCDLHVTDKRQSTTINFQQLETPNWWYELVNQPKTDFSDPEFERFKSISFTTGINPKINELLFINIYSISFIKNNTNTIWILVAIQFVITFSTIVLFFFLKSNKATVNQIEITYKPTLTENLGTKNDADFLGFIHTNYENPDLTLIEIAKKTGLSQRFISDSISETYNCNVKTYINQVRINEAKRLLISSELNINEIGYKVGFNSPANFNRVFKSLSSMSPSEFIQKNKAE